MSYIPSPDILALIDHTPIAEAQAEIDAANARFHEAKDAVLSAEAELVDARAAIPALTERAVAGERISAATVARAHARVRDVDRYRAFVTEVAHRLRPDERETAARMAAAKAKAHQPLLDLAAERRIAAAARADRADGDANRNTDHIEMDAAKRDYAAATAIMHFAIRAGARHPGTLPDQAISYAMPVWPSSEYVERQFWHRPEDKQDIAA